MQNGSRIIDVILDFLLGPVSLEEAIGPPPVFLYAHKGHMEKCPECERHYLCREIVCRLVCARCDKKCRMPNLNKARKGTET